MECGWHPDDVDKIGICPALVDSKYNGVHDGNNAGRACWMIAGTLCGGKVQGSYAQKQKSCVSCDFYRLVKKEEGLDFKMLVRP